MVGTDDGAEDDAAIVDSGDSSLSLFVSLDGSSFAGD